MSEKINDGGPAFPLKGPLLTSDCLGMSLRDYFAAKAMQSLISLGSNGYKDGGGFFHPENVADDAYNFADAMLEVGARYEYISNR